ncbi:hypothetical protein VQ02_04135 [Methylobacterium variabile]|jgi:hypothetical protein|uniref:Uncharacterized protein n=1 Tax=Methylobacterium variabile TaxID=298794 RepID=A0A0J6T3U3_9HYPH|nr:MULTISPECIES: hypothetical protein [Methylobacterium]KMO42110.1 hypothetical protein VQ02_04135 [Methylobacterium variabile]NGM37295.1 hypothetical protein [Methylobacterium sp. DB0501]UHC20351.1 hypothetical protein LRS73_34480 [Methylobacterium currus]
MTRFRLPAVGGLNAVIVAISVVAPAKAQTCFGVEARVNVATSALTTAITGAITTTEAALVAQEIAERARLLSAVKVLTAQSAAGSDQVSNGFRASSEALATTVVTQEQRQAVAFAAHRYGSIGYDPCGSNIKAQALFTAMMGSTAIRQQIVAPVRSQPGRYADPKDWVADVKSGDAPDGASLYSGDTAAASRFINAIVGPPDPQPRNSGASATNDLARLEKTGRDTYRSMTASVLADIAADYRTDGPIAQARTLSSHWQGNDGGAAWAAGVAGQHDRGIIQDAVRMEAANLALVAHQIKRGMRTEATAAALLLAMVNARISNSVAAPGRGSASPASFQTP